MVIKRREDYGGPGMTEHAVAFFFISYVLINSIMLLNVVVAVLLDEFISSVSREKEEDEKRERIERNKKKVAGFLDALTGTCLSDLISLDSPHPRCSVTGLDSRQIGEQKVHTIIESDQSESDGISCAEELITFEDDDDLAVRIQAIWQASAAPCGA